MKKGRELIPLKKLIIILAILMLWSIIYIPAAALELPDGYAAVAVAAV